MEKIKSLILILVVATMFVACSKPVDVSGVVTAYSDKEKEQKSDVGAKVYITTLKTDTLSDITKLQYLFYDYAKNWEQINQNQEWLDNTPTEYVDNNPTDLNAGTKEMYSKYISKYTNLNTQIENQFAQVSKKYNQKNIFELTEKILDNIKNNKETVTAIVDASGNFNVKIKPGNYNMVVRSNNRKIVYWGIKNGDEFKYTRSQIDDSIQIIPITVGKDGLKTSVTF